MYKYIKSAIDEDEVSELGLNAMWDDSSSRNEIIRTVQSMNSRDIVDILEEELDEDEFQRIMITIASNEM